MYLFEHYFNVVNISIKSQFLRIGKYIASYLGDSVIFLIPSDPVNSFKFLYGVEIRSVSSENGNYLNLIFRDAEFANF